MTDKVVIQTIIFAPPATVYLALTDAVALTAWFAEYVDCAPDKGRFAFWGRYTPFGDVPRQQLLAVDIDERLCLGWTVDGVETTVDITIQPVEAGDTTLTLIQSPVPTWDGDRASVADFWCLAIGNLANFVEGRSLVPRHDYLALPGEEAQAEIDIDASPEEVFEALIDPVHLDRWIAATAVVEPRAGGRYSFGWDHGPMKIIELDPPERLVYSWHNNGWLDTVVDWRIAPEGMYTRATVRHTGFVDGRPFDGYQIGWRDFLVRLQRMIEIGAAWRPFECNAP